MIKSMTGFGSASVTIGSTVLATEVRAVNSRFLDFKASLPKELNYLQDEIRRILNIVGGVNDLDPVQTDDFGGPSFGFVGQIAQTLKFIFGMKNTGRAEKEEGGLRVAVGVLPEKEPDEREVGKPWNPLLVFEQVVPDDSADNHGCPIGKVNRGFQFTSDFGWGKVP